MWGVARHQEVLCEGFALSFGIAEGAVFFSFAGLGDRFPMRGIPLHHKAGHLQEHSGSDVLPQFDRL